MGEGILKTTSCANCRACQMRRKQELLAKQRQAAKPRPIRNLAPELVKTCKDSAPQQVTQDVATRSQSAHYPLAIPDVIPDVIPQVAKGTQVTSIPVPTNVTPDVT